MRAVLNPRPGEFWATSKGRTIEIVARDRVSGEWEESVDTIAYQFLGGSMIHLRSVDSLVGWSKVTFE